MRSSLQPVVNTREVERRAKAEEKRMGTSFPIGSWEFEKRSDEKVAGAGRGPDQRAVQ
jgi:hypothetical protein